MQTGVSPMPVVLGADPERSVAEAAASSSAPAPALNETENLLFNVDKLNDAVTHANDMTKRYGVGVLSINIISAKPAHNELMQSLAKGAVAAAEAQQLEITARGRAKAAIIMSKGEADAEVTRAEGSKAAARLLNEESVAVDLAKIASTGDALAKAGTSLILGHDPAAMGSMLLANPNVMQRR